jgi:hypothetical protein
MKKPRNGRPIWNTTYNKTRPPFRGTTGVFRVELNRMRDGRTYKWSGGATTEDEAIERGMRVHGLKMEQMAWAFVTRLRKRGSI